MSKRYDLFKERTIIAANVIDSAKDMKAVSEDYAKGFRDAMWEAREAYMKIEDIPFMDEEE